MKKHMYINPSVQVTEMVMVQTLCVSGGGGGGGSFSPLNPDAITDEQL